MNRPLKLTPGCQHSGWLWLRARPYNDEKREFGDYKQYDFY